MRAQHAHIYHMALEPFQCQPCTSGQRGRTSKHWQGPRPPFVQATASEGAGPRHAISCSHRLLPQRRAHGPQASEGRCPFTDSLPPWYSPARGAPGVGWARGVPT